MAKITLERVRELLIREQESYLEKHPISKSMFDEACSNLVGGVPMSWMRIWAGGFPIFVERAEGVYITDVDGHTYLDLCLGDTGGLCGHANPYITEAICEQMKNRGTTTMLPTADSIWVGQELERRFGLPCWQILMTATDANRMALKVAREYTGRRLTLAFNGTYHGSVDETLCVNVMGYLINMPGLMGPLFEDPSVITRMIEFNDENALEEALSNEDIACVITEPVMTNVGIIKPEAGFHDALRRITRKYGTLLLMDETHSMCAGSRGVTGEMGLEPDIFVVGKFIAGGYPAAALGFSRDISDWMAARQPWHVFFGFGGTLSGNATAVAGIRAALENALSDAGFRRMIELAAFMEEGLQSVINKYELDWYVSRIGCRVEFRFLPEPPKNGSEALFADVPYNAVDIVQEGLTGPLEVLIHLFCANRGILLTPVHEMALVGPTATKEDIESYVLTIEALVKDLTDK